MEILTTQKGSEACNYGGFSYRVDTVTSIRKIWRCRTIGCKGRLWSDIDNCHPIEKQGHSHPPAPEIGIVMSTICKMKQRAKTETRSIPIIHSDAAAEISGNTSASAIFPAFKSINNVLYRARHEKLPVLPQSLNDIHIPDQLTQTISGQLFLLFISEDKSIILLGTISNLQMLSSNNHWFMDGTFRVAPPFYKQIFTIHALLQSKVLPLIYCILIDKKAETYTSVFRKIRDLCLEHNLILTPNLITLDFEKGLIVALQQEFPQSRLRGCYFHFCQAVFRQVQKLGFSVDYGNNQELRTKIRMLMALAFVPEQIVQQTFDNLRDEAPVNIRPLFQYFHQQWFQNIKKEMWNMYGIRRRTNNDVEGWHNRFNNLVDKHHPNIYDLISCIRKEQGFTETLMAQINAGQVINKTNKKYNLLNERISKLQQRFDDGEIGVQEFIRGISFSLSTPIAF